jgi:hypothetical protein
MTEPMIETAPRRRGKTNADVVTATLRWISPEKGGRKAPPSNPTYRAVPRFEADPNASRGLWDVVVTFSRPPGPHAKTSTVRMTFVSAGAPKSLLRSGRRFELTEGAKVVAQGEVR